jgi:hypothetical protein
MSTWPDHPRLRRCGLAAAVLHDLDIVPATDGFVLPGTPAISVSWSECRHALGGHDAESPEARESVSRWLRLRRTIADLPTAELQERARPYGAIVESSLHPGLDWINGRVLGDSLDLGIAFVGLLSDRPDEVVPVAHRLLRAADIDTQPWWREASAYLERMGALAAQRLRRMPQAPLRPMGDCDVVTLLGSATLRAALAAGCADGMRTVAVPTRTRGWLDLSRADPGFVVAAAALTNDDERGFPRPLLVTREEVSLVRAGGDVARPVVEQVAEVVDLREYARHRS